MSFQPLKHNFNHVRALPDRPRISEGYTPETLKETFDRAGEVLQDYLNNTLLPALSCCENENSAAESLGSAALKDIPAGSIHSQLSALQKEQETLHEELKSAAEGVFPPESIGKDRLRPELQETIDTAANKDTRLSAFTTAGKYVFTAPKTGLYLVKMCAGGGAGSFANPAFEDFNSVSANVRYNGRGGAAGASLEAYLTLTQGEELHLCVGAGGRASEIEKLPTSSTENGFTAEEITHYLETERWVALGEDTTLCDKDENPLFVCHGADPRKVRVYAECFKEGPPCFLHAGEGFLRRAPSSEEEDTLFFSNVGLSAAFGQGGEYAQDDGTLIDAGFGAGGAGGALYLNPPNFDVVDAPGDGGAGAVFLEYIQ